MTTAWNGLPDRPERKGWHVIIDNTGDRHEFWWEGPDFQYWTTTEGGDLIWSIEEMAAEYSYAGAIYSSSELAQMLHEQREKDAQVAERYASQFAEPSPTLRSDCRNIASGIRINPLAIRALTDEPPHA